MITTSETYPYAYTSLRAQISINNLHPSAIATLGNNGNATMFYNRNVLSNVNKVESALDVLFNHSLKYGVKFSFGGEQYFINKNVIASRNLDVIIHIDEKEGVIFYNTDYDIKRTLKVIFDAVLESSDKTVKPMITEHINRLYWKQLPKYNFKSIKQMRERFREISVEFLQENNKLFTKI